jgi:hypothetical protein
VMHRLSRIPTCGAVSTITDSSKPATRSLSSLQIAQACLRVMISPLVMSSALVGLFFAHGLCSAGTCGNRAGNGKKVSPANGRFHDWPPACRWCRKYSSSARASFPRGRRYPRTFGVSSALVAIGGCLFCSPGTCSGPLGIRPAVFPGPLLQRAAHARPAAPGVDRRTKRRRFS